MRGTALLSNYWKLSCQLTFVGQNSQKVPTLPGPKYFEGYLRIFRHINHAKVPKFKWKEPSLFCKNIFCVYLKIINLIYIIGVETPSPPCRETFCNVFLRGLLIICRSWITLVNRFLSFNTFWSINPHCFQLQEPKTTYTISARPASCARPLRCCPSPPPRVEPLT